MTTRRRQSGKPKAHMSLRGRRPWQSVSQNLAVLNELQQRWKHFGERIATSGCALLAMTQESTANSSNRNWKSSGMVGGGSAARPTGWIESLRREYHTKKKTTLSGGFPFGGLEGIRLHFRCAKIKVLLRQAVAGNSPPDCCIGLFESLLREYHTKQKDLPFGRSFCLVEQGAS